MKEWSAAAAEGRRLAEGAAVNATLLLSVPAASEATARQFFTDPVAVESARQMLARDGQPLAALEAMRVERVFAQRADQSDVYSCYDGVLSAEEADVDCGGVCTAKCAAGKRCAVDGDCASGACKEGTCQRFRVTAGVVWVIVVLVIVVVAVIVAMVLVLRGRKPGAEAKAAEKEIEMVRQRKEAEIADLEKLDAQEEADLQKLEKHVKRKHRHAARNGGSQTVPAPAIPTESAEEVPAPAIPTESVAEVPAPAIPTESVAEVPAPAIPTESAAEVPAPAIPTESTAEEVPAPAIPTESTAEVPAPAIPTESAAEVPAPAIPTESTAELPTDSMIATAGSTIQNRTEIPENGARPTEVDDTENALPEATPDESGQRRD